MIAQHSSVTNEHHTPANIVEAARSVMGVIDLDPASCVKANETVRAAKFFDREDNGLAQEWSGCIFCNPPGGTIAVNKADREEFSGSLEQLKKQYEEEREYYQTRSRACAWWRKTTREFESGRIKQAVFIGFTLELLRAAQGEGWAHPFDFTICVPRDRLKFAGDDPTHANVIVYLGDSVERFKRVFSEFGVCK